MTPKHWRALRRWLAACVLAVLTEQANGRLAATCYRLAAWDTPLSVLPSRRPGRYNHAGEGPTQYLALHPLTPWAELLRFDGRRTEDEADELRPPLWSVRVTLEPERTVELTFDNAPAWGLNPEDLVSDTRGATQALAAGMRSDPSGPTALVVPSAALPGTRNLVLLGAHVKVEYDQSPVDDGDIGTALAAMQARAPRGLVGAVHHRDAGINHAGLEAWRLDEELVVPPFEP
jgi:RES domain-containing protein